MLNMKFEVTKDQPLGDIVRELERRGYVAKRFNHNCNSICTYDDGTYICYMMRCELKYQDLCITTLAELKEMEC